MVNTRGGQGRSLRVLIADHDELCRQRIRTLLDAESDVEIVAECSRAPEIIDAIHVHKPDVLLLEPRVPGGRPLDLLASLPPESLPLLIFITSQDQYAVKAFETKAFDFIMKPYDQRRLHGAIKRARDDVTRMQGDALTLRQIDLIRKVRSVPEQRLIFKMGGRVIFLDVDEVDWVEAAANYVAIHAGSEVYRIREPIGQLEKRIANHNFSRIHRGIIVNVTKIKQVYPCNSGEYMIRLKNGKELPCSRNYNSAIRALLRAVNAESIKD
ncbi:MAG: LytTR family DNA-binding domain-containing protein [Candidatus Acidiferrum sp.]